MNPPKVTFLKVSSKEEKLLAIYDLLNRLFHRGKRCAIWTGNEQAVQYLDQWLWRHERESFLPHSTANRESPIFITQDLHVHPECKVVLNLRPDPLPDSHSFVEIYELEDHSSPEALAISKEKRKRLEG